MTDEPEGGEYPTQVEFGSDAWYKQDEIELEAPELVATDDDEE